MRNNRQCCTFTRQPCSLISSFVPLLYRKSSVASFRATGGKLSLSFLFESQVVSTSFVFHLRLLSIRRYQMLPYRENIPQNLVFLNVRKKKELIFIDNCWNDTMNNNRSKNISFLFFSFRELRKFYSFPPSRKIFFLLRENPIQFDRIGSRNGKTFSTNQLKRNAWFSGYCRDIARPR